MPDWSTSWDEMQIWIIYVCIGIYSADTEPIDQFRDAATPLLSCWKMLMYKYV